MLGTQSRMTRSRRALAIYREAMNMQHFHSLPYAVLGFYKILESTYPDGPERGKKLEQQVANLLAHDGLKIYQLREIGFDLNKSPKHGRYVADAIERRREISGLLRAMKALTNASE
jgi:hypothetical protein